MFPAERSSFDIDTSNLQWSCTTCNSSKSGKKGLYTNIPKWIEVCPNRGGDCGYSFRGEASSE